MTLEFGLGGRFDRLGQVLWLRTHCIIYCMQMLLAIAEEGTQTKTGTGKSGQGTRECRLPEILLNFNRIQRVCPDLAVSEAVSAAGL